MNTQSSLFRSRNDVYKGSACAVGIHHRIDRSKLSMSERERVCRDVLRISRADAKFCTSIAVNVNPCTLAILPYTLHKTLIRDSIPDEASSIQRKSYWTSTSVRRLVNLTCVPTSQCDAFNHTISIPCSTLSLLTTHSNSTRKWKTLVGISPSDLTTPKLSKANTMPNLTASNTATSSSESPTLQMYAKTLCSKARKWLRGLTRTEKQTLFDATHGETQGRETTDFTYSSHTVRTDSRERELWNARILLEPKSTVELLDELMLLFQDAKKGGFVVESG